MITPTMTPEEVNEEITGCLKDLELYIDKKVGHRIAAKNTPQQEISKYTIQGNLFYICYYRRNNHERSVIFCRYYTTNHNPVYVSVVMRPPNNVDFAHMTKHSLDRYNERLNLNLRSVEEILLLMGDEDLLGVENYDADENTKPGEVVLMIRRVKNGAFLGHIIWHGTERFIKTFIDNSLLRNSQNPALDHAALDMVAQYENDLGGDVVARKRVARVIALYDKK